MSGEGTQGLAHTQANETPQHLRPRRYSAAGYAHWSEPKRSLAVFAGMKLDPDRKAHFLFAAVIVVGALLVLGWYIADATGYRVYHITTPDTRSRLVVAPPG